MARIKMHIPRKYYPFTLQVRLNAGCKMGCQHTRTRKNIWHPRAPFGTFGVPNGTLKGPIGPLLGFGPTSFGWQ